MEDSNQSDAGGVAQHTEKICHRRHKLRIARAVMFLLMIHLMVDGKGAAKVVARALSLLFTDYEPAGL